MKTVGVKAVDDTFKVAIQPLRDGTDLRENVQASLGNFREVCGVAPRSNLKQCIRLLASRLDLTSEFMALGLVMKDEVPFKTYSLLVINRPVCNYQNSYTWRIMEQK
ncbi:inactive phospholipase C-like protein 1 [Porites lutea]|uniref:inactive phospholipase C-like protein 1 n=1 Tax=Porites lutea TaxID=51062 RepID=UPI003CC6BBA0